MKKLTLLTFGILLVSTIRAIDFTSKQNAVIYNEAINTIRQYENLLNKMADQSVDLDQSGQTGEKFIELFIARKALIYNDLDPAHQMSEFYELDTYVANLQLWYPDGLKIKIDFDNLKAGNITSHEENVFTIDILASKKMDGNYVNKARNLNNEELLFRLAFYKDGAVFKGFKIAGIRSTASKLQSDSKNLTEVKGQNIDEKEMDKIRTQIKAVVNDYVNFLNLLADPKETGEDKEYFKTSFLNLFSNDKVNHVNDIQPKPEKRWLSAGEYLQNYLQAFPEGIRNLGVNIDSAKYGRVIPVEKNKYTISVKTDKFFSGKYKDKTTIRENAKFDFKISFERIENTYKNFRIDAIDKDEITLNEQHESTLPAELPKHTITAIKRTGLHIGAGVSYDFLSYKNANLLKHDVLKWKKSAKGEITPSLIVRYYPFNKLGVETGITLDNYNVELRLNGLYTSNLSLTDNILGNNYYQQIAAYNYDSVITSSYLRVPLSLVYHSNLKPELPGFYIKAGLAFSFLLNSKYTTTADSLSNPRVYDIPSYITDPDLREKFYAISMNDGANYYSKRNINKSGKAETNGIGISLIASIGVTIPVGYFASFDAGPEIVYGLSDVNTKKNHTDMLDNNVPAKKVHFIKYGFKIGFNYKF